MPEADVPNQEAPKVLRTLYDKRSIYIDEIIKSWVGKSCAVSFRSCRAAVFVSRASGFGGRSWAGSNLPGV